MKIELGIEFNLEEEKNNKRKQDYRETEEERRRRIDIRLVEILQEDRIKRKRIEAEIDKISEEIGVQLRRIETREGNRLKVHQKRYKKLSEKKEALHRTWIELVEEIEYLEEELVLDGIECGW